MGAPAGPAPSLDLTRIRAITLDLDDTLWPIWPTIARAEAQLQAWLAVHAPAAHGLAQQRDVVRRIRAEVQAEHAGLAHDLSALRREAIRRTLVLAGEDPALAGEAFEVFLAARQQVELFDDALPALERLGRRYPLVALTNGNADVRRVGLGRFFRAAVSACEAGVAKPDARIFQLGAGAAGVPAAQVLHVGDDALLDAQGALDAGMQAVWLRRPAALAPPGQRPGAAHDGHRPGTGPVAQGVGPAGVPPAEPACAVVPDLHALCRLLGLA
ncbi:HAD-IA family hydrolase [Melaminivora sp.]|uniref:HAD family hydrolase n=1 Tax=Melaminivora sp. TaxID=1933032 RepID=UPI0028A7A334|nr:HAD-IA family hydrolase [Melaminivora sp.]